VAKYSLFKEKFNPKADIVYHPCGGADVSPSEVFPESRVVYADIHTQSVDALKKVGVEAHETSALEFNPGDVDILIMLNPQIRPEFPASFVLPNGFVLCNDYHLTASLLKESGQFELRGVIIKNKEGELFCDTENLEDYFKEVETDEEFKRIPFTWGDLNYRHAMQTVEAITGKKENIVAEYKEIIKMAREQTRKINAEILKGNPGSEEFFKNKDTEEVFTFEHNGEPFLIETSFPKKKGSNDDLFVFQKGKAV
jgi:hypothetical protein